MASLERGTCRDVTSEPVVLEQSLNLLRSAGLLCTDGSDDLASGVILFFSSRRFWCVLRFPQNWKQRQESSSSSNSVTIDAPSHKPTAPPRSEQNWISCKRTTRHVYQSHPAAAANPDDVTHRVSLNFIDPLNVEVSVVDSQVDEVFPASTDNACYDVCVTWLGSLRQPLIDIHVCLFSLAQQCFLL